MKVNDILALVGVGLIAYKIGETIGKKIVKNTEGGNGIVSPVDPNQPLYQYKAAGSVVINGGFSI